MPQPRKRSRSPQTRTEPPPNGSLSTSPTSQDFSLRRRRSPFFPTRLETLLLAIYPGTLLLGSIFSTLSPITRNSPYNPVTQSHIPEHAPSYFARKKNVFNIYFVKIGWFWATLALFIFLFTHPSIGPPLRPTVTPHRTRLVLRWAAVTAWWACVTQWFFGPPLIDRGFRITGGKCEVLKDPEARAAMSTGGELLTAASCKLAGGTWKGGHDISGHVFLLILGSALLWFEILPGILKAEGLRDGRAILMADGQVRSAAAEADRVTHGATDEQEQVTKVGVKFAVGVWALMWWMLLMTAAFFHTWFEKFTGLMVAFAGLWVVYFLPRGVPGLRAVIGMPGV